MRKFRQCDGSGWLGREPSIEAERRKHDEQAEHLRESYAKELSSVPIETVSGAESKALKRGLASLRTTPTDTERLAAVHELIEAARDLTDYGMGCSLVSQLTSPRTNYCSAHGAEVSGGGWPCRYEQRCQRLRAAIDAATTNDD